MLRSLPLLLLALFAFEANAAFSMFVHVTPENQKEYGFHVCVDRNYLDTELVEVRIRGEQPLRGGWLIITHEYVDESGQQFREYIWNDNATDSPIESITDLQHDEEYGVTRVLLPQDAFPRSYLYFDFPEPVFDGGFYFSIDLSTFADSAKDDC